MLKELPLGQELAVADRQGVPAVSGGLLLPIPLSSCLAGWLDECGGWAGGFHSAAVCLAGWLGSGGGAGGAARAASKLGGWRGGGCGGGGGGCWLAGGSENSGPCSLA